MRRNKLNLLRRPNTLTATEKLLLDVYLCGVSGANFLKGVLTNPTRFKKYNGYIRYRRYMAHRGR